MKQQTLRTATVAVFGTVLSVFAMSGCDSGQTRASVSGIVTFDGQPLDNGTITFEPVDRTTGQAGGASIEAGKFDLPAERGLAPGEYKVSISANVGGGPENGSAPPGEPARVPKQPIPAKYNTATTLTRSVKAGDDNVLQFDLKAK